MPRAVGPATKGRTVYSPTSWGRIRHRLIQLVAFNALGVCTLLAWWIVFSIDRSPRPLEFRQIAGVPALCFVLSLILVYRFNPGTYIVDDVGLTRIGRTGKAWHLDWCEVERVRVSPQGARLEGSGRFVDLEWFCLGKADASDLRKRLAYDYLPEFELENLGPRSTLRGLLLGQANRRAVAIAVAICVAVVTVIASLPLKRVNRLNLCAIAALSISAVLIMGLLGRALRRWERDIKTRHPEFPWRTRYAGLRPGE